MAVGGEGKIQLKRKLAPQLVNRQHSIFELLKPTLARQSESHGLTPRHELVMSARLSCCQSSCDMQPLKLIEVPNRTCCRLSVNGEGPHVSKRIWWVARSKALGIIWLLQFDDEAGVLLQVVGSAAVVGVGSDTAAST